MLDFDLINGMEFLFFFALFPFQKKSTIETIQNIFILIYTQFLNTCSQPSPRNMLNLNGTDLISYRSLLLLEISVQWESLLKGQNL